MPSYLVESYAAVPDTVADARRRGQRTAGLSRDVRYLPSVPCRPAIAVGILGVPFLALTFAIDRLLSRHR